jgi:hypothetical protein
MIGRHPHAYGGDHSTLRCHIDYGSNVTMETVLLNPTYIECNYGGVVNTIPIDKAASGPFYDQLYKCLINYVGPTSDEDVIKAIEVMKINYNNQHPNKTSLLSDSDDAS